MQILNSWNYLKIALVGLASVPDQLEYISAKKLLTVPDLMLEKMNRSTNTRSTDCGSGYYLISFIGLCILPCIIKNQDNNNKCHNDQNKL